MGGRGRSSSATKMNTGGGGSFSILTDKDAQAMRDLQDSMYDPMVTAGIKMYISNTNYDGQGHSLSQTLNHRLNNDIDISSDNSLVYTDSVMSMASHQLGKDIQLQRGCHQDFVQSLGIKNYTNMSEQQLQKQLVGTTAQFKSYVSTSYDVNKNPFLSSQSGSGVSGGREVKINLNTKGSTKGLFGAKKQSEIILNKGTNFKVTGVRFAKDANGNQIYVYPRNGGRMPQLEIDIETW